MTRLHERGAQLVALAILVATGVAAAIFAAGAWTLEDMRVYLDAARRLSSGDPLYSTPNPLAAYQYAPWFAAAWIPATALPEVVVEVGWSAILVAASVVTVLPLLRRPSVASVALAALMLPLLLFSSARSGNVQPLLVAVLVVGLERRWAGPVGIAATASLKAFPLAFALVYVGRREWDRAAVAGIAFLMLTAPMLLFDLSAYTADGPRPGTLFDISPLLWGLPVAGLVMLSLWLAARGSRYAWLGAASTVVMGLPRMLTYDLTFLLAGSPVRPRARSANPTSTKLIS
ncbi:MAG: glycosyltransferase 87 family protein [Chloroflexi bacterium]|nr:glycosyltransferase 87 family protein [Chloroflexota bacterium]